MQKRSTRNVGALWAAMLLLGIAGGCSTDTEMNGIRVPNATPDTRVTGQPPTLLEASYAVEFRWTGSDPDGRIKGYQWKMSDNGTDGISPQDTLTVDPLTGAVINPWYFTASTDSTFLVLADQAGFPGDVGNPRSFRSHSLFVRAVDDKGAVDPTPAYISFTSTTIVPTCRVNFPSLGGASAYAVPRTVNIGVTGVDPDFELRTPTKVRTLWIPAVDDEGAWVISSYRYQQVYSEILSYDDPTWTPWRPYLPEEEDRVVSIPNQTVGNYFFFATQVQDTAGAVSVGFGYQTEVANVVVRDNIYRPDFTISEPFLGSKSSTEWNSPDGGPIPIAGGQPLNFSWIANAAAYNGNIVSMQHGWDLIDVNDPNDPGWAVPPGLSEQNRRATERSFNEGLHTFTLRIIDDSNQILTMKATLRVIPFVERPFQLPLLVIDQVEDRNSNAWPSRDGRPMNDQLYRNAFWHFLAEGSGGVADINWARDWKDHTITVRYEDIVGYKAVLCYARNGNNVTQTLLGQFKPVAGREQYVWLTPYQQQGGNFMLVGATSMESFLQYNSSTYMTPLIFNNREDPTFTIFGQSYVSGFGTLTLPDGTIVQRGPRMYPFTTAGIAAIDWTSAPTKHIYARQPQMSVDRSRLCSGLKGLVLDPAFKSNHLIGPGVIPDTMFTNPEIDWRDEAAAAVDTLNLLDQQAFVHDADEFYDTNISGTRSSPIQKQECTGPEYANSSVPNGLCVEPMFTGIARLDWMREVQIARGRTDWPHSRYDDEMLDDGCGSIALTSWDGVERSSARTNGEMFGFLSYKTVPTKQWKAADIYWGFDPYRFDHNGAKKAIRWALQYFGLQINQ
ncbi:MAG: hypothetical protein IPJ24_08340 [bacterium]|nr:hypothetical protein [bacterium]